MYGNASSTLDLGFARFAGGRFRSAAPVVMSLHSVSRLANLDTISVGSAQVLTAGAMLGCLPTARGARSPVAAPSPGFATGHEFRGAGRGSPDRIVPASTPSRHESR